MKRSSSNTNFSGKPAKQTDSGRRWGLGTWLNRLSEYVHHKNADDRSVRSDSGNCSRTDSVLQADSKICSTLDDCVPNINHGLLSNGSLARQSLNRTGLLSVKRSSTIGSADVGRRSSIANSTTGVIPQQTRTPVVRRFTRDCSLFSGSTESQSYTTGAASASHSSIMSIYPVSQPQYPGVGIMPSVKLAQYTDRRTPTLGSHNSLMMGSSSVRVKIAPPDASRSPLSEQSFHRLERPASPAESVSSTRSVASALRENRKRLFCSDDVNESERHNSQQNKRWRPNHDDADQPTALAENNLSFVPNDSSPLANRPNYIVTNADTSCSSSQGQRFGSRNPIDVSYLSSSHVHKQSHDDRSQAGVSPGSSLPISRNSSVCGSISGSQVRVYDDGRISAGNSESPLASAPSSGRNTPVPSIDGGKLDRNTPLPLSLDASRHGATPEKHRQLLLIKDGTCKRRLAPLCADISTSFKPSVQRKHSLSVKDFDRDRRLEMERARQLLRDVTSGTSIKGDALFMGASTLLSTSQSATFSAPVSTGLSTETSNLSVPASTTSLFSNALNVLPIASTTSGATASLAQSTPSSGFVVGTSSAMPPKTEASKEVAGFKLSLPSSNASTVVSSAEALTSLTLPVFGNSSTTSNSSTDAQPGVTSASVLTFGNSVASNNQSHAFPFASTSLVSQFANPLVTTASNVAVSLSAFNPGSLNLFTTSSSAIKESANSRLSQSALVQDNGKSTLSTCYPVASSAAQQTVLSTSTLGNSVSQSGPKLHSTLNMFANPTNFSSSSGTTPATTSSMLTPVFSKPETCASVAASPLVSNSSSDFNNRPVSVFGNTPSAFGNSLSNTSSFSFGSSQPQAASVTSSAQMPMFPPVFGSSTSAPLSSTTSSMLGVNNVVSSQNTASPFNNLTLTTSSGLFGNNATVTAGFGASDFGNKVSDLSGFGNSSTTPIGLGAAVHSSIPMRSGFGGFQLSSTVNTATTNILPFGHAAVNGLATQSAANPSFGFSGSSAEKSVAVPGNGFAFGSGNSLSTRGPTALSATNGVDFQTSTPAFKFGGSGDGFTFGGNTAAVPVFGASNGTTGVVQFGSPSVPGYSPLQTQGSSAVFTIGSASAGRSAVPASRRAGRSRATRR